MTPDRAADLVARWVGLYTRGLPPSVAARRVEEVGADVREHIVHERGDGVPETRIARHVLGRTVRGMPADALWRHGHVRSAAGTARSTGGPPTVRRSAVRVLAGVLLVLTLPLIATLASDGEGWGVGDFVLAGVLLTTVGVAVELALRRAGSVLLATGVAAVGVAAGLLGQADDAPGLVLLGILLVVGAGAMGVRRVTR